MPILGFGEWLPDIAALGNPGSPRVRNALPKAVGYGPIGSLQPSLTPLAARPVGGIAAVDRQQIQFLYVGTATKLYVLSGAVWSDVSKAGGYTTPATGNWRFVQWKNKVLATNFAENPQFIDMGAAAFADLTTDFRAKYLTTIGDFVFAANTSDVTDGDIPDRVRWSAFNDETDWTPSSVTGSDARDLNEGGAIQGLVGGEYGLMVSERATWRIQFVGAPGFFQIDNILPGIGTFAPNSIAQLGDSVYYLNEQGFVRIRNGNPPVDWIGAGKVDRFIQTDLDTANVHRMSVAVDKAGGRIAWAYPNGSAVEGLPNRVIIYDAVLNRWTLLDLEVEMLWNASSASTTLEGLDSLFATLEDVPASLDAQRWKGGAPEFAAFNPSFESGFFDGTAMVAEFDTAEAELAPGRRAALRSFRGVVVGSTAEGQVGYRQSQSDPVTFLPFTAQRPSGRFAARRSARYHRFRLRVDSSTWTDALGVQIEPDTDLGPAERR